MFTEKQTQERKEKWVDWHLGVELKHHKNLGNYRWREKDWKTQWHAAFSIICELEPNVFSNNQVLADIGCGSRLCLDWFSSGIKYCVDPLLDKYRSISGLEEYWKEKKDVTLIQGPGEERINELENRCDFLVCWNVLDHTFDPYAVISNLHFYLKSTGTLLIATDYTKKEAPSHPGWDSITLFYRYLYERFDLVKQHDNSIPRKFWERDVTLVLNKK